jgi:hypothetical protein
MTFLRRLRLIAGALVYDWLPFERRLRGFGAKAGEPAPWLSIRNRGDRVSFDGRGVHCDWRFGNELHIANVLPSTGKRLMRVALERWPIAFAEEPRHAGTPAVTFVIGHRGIERLPHLLMTLRTIAAQSVPIECVVVEQSHAPEIPSRLPPWVRYVHTAVSVDFPYSRSQTLNAGVAHAQSGVFILHDNDMLVPAAYAAEAVARAAEGWSFANLKRFIFYLPPDESRRLFATGRLRASKSTVVQNLHGASIVAERNRSSAGEGRTTISGTAPPRRSASMISDTSRWFISTMMISRESALATLPPSRVTRSSKRSHRVSGSHGS